MAKINLEGYLKSYRETEDALNSSVKINHREVLKLVIIDLLVKRNSPGNDMRGSFDKVLLYYLGRDDFEKYVVRKEVIE